MTRNAKAIRFEVHINGERLCMAGMPEYGVLDTSVDWVVGRPDRRLSNYTLGLRVGGLDTSEPNQDDWVHVLWALEDLKEGDEVTIRILGPGDVDEPQSYKPYRERPRDAEDE